MCSAGMMVLSKYYVLRTYQFQTSFLLLTSACFATQHYTNLIYLDENLIFCNSRSIPSSVIHLNTLDSVSENALWMTHSMFSDLARYIRMKSLVLLLCQISTPLAHHAIWQVFQMHFIMQWVTKFCANQLMKCPCGLLLPF